MLNKVMIIGNLGADPDMRYTANGSAVTTFRVAATRSFTDKESGRKKEETEWFSVVTWNHLAELCAQYLVKGRTVYVEGRLATRSWDDQATGTKKYRTEVIAEEIKFLGGRDHDGGGGGFPPGMNAVGADGEGDIDPDELPF